jgi:hypothetical protein
MQPNLLIAIILPLFIHCSNSPASPAMGTVYPGNENPFAKIESISLPEGYHRITLETGSFGEWLRRFPLKKDKTVYKFDGSKKQNQSAQFAVLDISTGKKDLQQCADAIMRLRAEYLYEQKRYSEISFSDNNGKKYNSPVSADRNEFDRYLETVFSWCGTLSLAKQLIKVNDLSGILPGDVLIKGGSPGHAAIVVDVAINKKGEKIYLLANSYMPAQDIHIVINPGMSDLNPWYTAVKQQAIELPEWTFTADQLRRF